MLRELKNQSTADLKQFALRKIYLMWKHHKGFTSKISLLKF